MFFSRCMFPVDKLDFWWFIKVCMILLIIMFYSLFYILEAIFKMCKIYSWFVIKGGPKTELFFESL